MKPQTNSIANQTTTTHTLPEAAQQLRVSTRFLQAEAKRGNLKVIRLSKKATRIRATDLAAYLESKAA